jgi:hypothetical protein
MTARQYRVRLFDGRYELLRERTVETVYDRQEQGIAAHRQASTLDALLWNMGLIAQEEDRSIEMGKLRLVLCEIDDDERAAFDWVARS